MKLVDILARELAVWPAHIVCLWICNGNTIYGQYGHHEYSLDGGWPIPEDALTSVVYRDQWQAAVDALKAEKVVEWRRGELPPVGTICEHAPGGSSDDWYRVEIIEHRRFNDAPYLCAVFVTHNDVSFSSHESFRPIRTPEQIVAEQLRNDELMYGTSYAVAREDGSLERIDPAKIIIRHRGA